MHGALLARPVNNPNVRQEGPPYHGPSNNASFSAGFYYTHTGPIPSATSTAPCDTTSAVTKIENIAAGSTTVKQSLSIMGRTAIGAVALAPDRSTLYAITCDTNHQMNIDTVSAQSTGVVMPSRSLGPFPNYAPLALAVDLQGNLYAGLTDLPFTASSNTHVRVYAPGGPSGKPAPVRIIKNPIPPAINQRITGIAITQ